MHSAGNLEQAAGGAAGLLSEQPGGLGAHPQPTGIPLAVPEKRSMPSARDKTQWALPGHERRDRYPNGVERCAEMSRQPLPNLGKE